MVPRAPVGSSAGESASRELPVARLERSDVRRLQALRTLGNVEFNSLPLIEGFVAVALNRGEVDENVLS